MQSSCVTPITGTWSVNPEGHVTAFKSSRIMGAQLTYLTRYQRDHTCRKRTCLLPSHMLLCRCSHMSSTRKKEGFHGVQLQICKLREKIEARHGGKLFNTSIDVVRPEIRLIVSLYVNEFLD